MTDQRMRRLTAVTQIERRVAVAGEVALDRVRQESVDDA
jgi:hypothetical protein